MTLLQIMNAISDVAIATMSAVNNPDLANVQRFCGRNFATTDTNAVPVDYVAGKSVCSKFI